jgi:hypothetical protein
MTGNLQVTFSLQYKKCQTQRVGGGAFFQCIMRVIKGNEWFETSNITKCKFRNVVEKMVCTIVSNDVHYCVKSCALLCQMMCTIVLNSVHYFVK